MSFENKPPEIPPERETAYLANAEMAVNEATEPVVKELGALVLEDAQGALNDITPGGPVDQAEKLIKDDSRAADIPEQAAAFVERNDLSDNFVENVTRQMPNPVEDAEAILAEQNLKEEAFRAKLANSTPWPKEGKTVEPAKAENSSSPTSAKEILMDDDIANAILAGGSTGESIFRKGKPKLTREADRDEIYSYENGYDYSWRHPDTKVEGFESED